MTQPAPIAGPLDRWFQVALVVLLAVSMLPFVLTSATHADEFTYLSHAARMLRGDVPYRDFFELVTPLSFTLTAGLFKLFGPSLLIARAWQALLLVLSGWQLFRLGRRLEAPPLVAMLPGWLLVAALYRLLPIYNHHWLVVPWVLAALLAGLAGLREGGVRWWGLSGLAAGGAFLGLQSDGAIVAIALVLMAALGGWAAGEAGWRAGARRAGAVLAGFALPILLGALVLAAMGALRAAIDQIWTFPLVHYKSAGSYNNIKIFTDLAWIASVTDHWVSLPYWYMRTGYYLILLAYTPLLALVGVCWGLDLGWRRVFAGRTLSPRELSLALVALVVCGNLLVASRGRADSIHLGLYGVPALALAAVLAWRWALRFAGVGGALIRWLPLAGLVGFGAAGIVLQAHEMRADPAEWLSWSSPDARIERSPAVAYLRAHGRPGDRLIAFPFGGLYDFYAWPSASRYTEMVPPEDGYHTAEEYRAFWDEIATRRPRFLVFQPLQPEASVHALYFRYPLPGYRLVATLPSAQYAPNLPAYIYERN